MVFLYIYIHIYITRYKHYVSQTTAYDDMGLVKVFEAWPDLAYSYKISQHAVNGV